MPQLQSINFQEQDTPLEKTVQGYIGREKDLKNTDSLRKIYDQYQQEGQSLQQALIKIQTDPSISPSARVQAAEQVANFQKYNKELQDDTWKRQKEHNVQQRHEEATAKSKKSEERLEEQNIRGIYNDTIKELENELKRTRTKANKEPIEQKINQTRKLRDTDLKKFRAGERGFNLSLYEEQQGAEEADPVIEELTDEFPPEKFKGKSKWDQESGQEYISDGVQWQRV